VGVGLVLLPAAVGGALLGSVLGMPGDLVSATVNAPLQMLGVGLIAAYGRDQEREADTVGQKMAADAGIDPKGLTDFMDTLEAYEKLRTGETRRPSFFDSHPTTPERVASTRERAAALRWTARPGIAADRPSFLKRIEGLLVGANPAEGVFDDEQFLHPDLDFTVIFPKDWKTVNSRAGVGAFAPTQDAQILLELQGLGEDPRAAAQEALAQLSKQVGVKVLESAPLRIGSHSAYRVHLRATRGRESVPLDITWIAKDALVYRITGMAEADAFERYASALRAVPEGFRTLSPMERDAIRERRLRLATARGGESLAHLTDRTRNVWDEGETRVANELSAGEALEGGHLIKVAVAEPYQPRPPKPRTSE
jgi:predicted Zn-dependent protease